MKKFNFSTLVKLAGTALLAFGLSGCPTTYNMGTARTIGAGNMEFNTTLVYNGLDLDALNGTDPNSGDSLGVVAIPFVDFGYRYGVADNMDFGISLKGFGKVGVDFKVSLLDTDSLVLSVDPEISGTQLGGAGVIQFDLPVLVDFVLSEDFSVTLAVKYSGYMPFAGDDAELVNFVGGTLGLDIALGDAFAIHPFAGVTYMMGDFGDGVEVILPHGGLGLRIGI